MVLLEGRLERVASSTLDEVGEGLHGMRGEIAIDKGPQKRDRG
jgi:hypothetical protein